MKAREITRSRPQEILKWFAVLVLVYLVSALILFDFTNAAYSMEADTRNGKEVAYGPRPREFVIGARAGLPGQLHREGVALSGVRARLLALEKNAGL